MRGLWKRIFHGPGYTEADLTQGCFKLDIEDLVKGARAAVFDFDGTLWNIELDWRGLYERFTEVGRLYGHVGEFRNILEAYNWSRKVYGARRKLIEVQDEFEESGLPGTPVAAGMECARWRKRNKLMSGVVSLNTTSTIERVIGSWGLYPIISIDKVDRPKPNPEGVIRVLDTLGCTPGEAVFIGNSNTDRKSAEAASIEYVDVTQIEEAWFE